VLRCVPRPELVAAANVLERLPCRVSQQPHAATSRMHLGLRGAASRDRDSSRGLCGRV